MNEHVADINLIVRSWNKSDGLNERIEKFTSLDQFFAACLNVGNPELIDRLIINGTDSNNKERTLTFVFQSVTVDGKPASK